MILQHSDIATVLPHRDPILLVDKVISLDAERITAIKNVSGNDGLFKPKTPGAAYPISLLIESLCQAAAVLFIKQLDGVPPGQVLLFGSLRGFTMHAPVYPGDTLVHTAILEKLTSDAAVFSGYSEVDGKRVTSIESAVTALRPSEGSELNV